MESEVAALDQLSRDIGDVLSQCADAISDYHAHRDVSDCPSPPAAARYTSSKQCESTAALSLPVPPPAAPQPASRPPVCTPSPTSSGRPPFQQPSRGRIFSDGACSIDALSHLAGCLYVIVAILHAWRLPAHDELWQRLDYCVPLGTGLDVRAQSSLTARLALQWTDPTPVSGFEHICSPAVLNYVLHELKRTLPERALEFVFAFFRHENNRLQLQEEFSRSTDTLSAPLLCDYTLCLSHELSKLAQNVRYCQHITARAALLRAKKFPNGIITRPQERCTVWHDYL